MEILKIKKLSKKYGKKDSEILAVNNVSFNVRKGEFIAIVGPSGSGKSTLLNLLAGLDKADNGEIIINKTDICKLNDKQMTIFRRDNIGFIYQFYNLIPTLTVKENILLPTLLTNNRQEENYQKLITKLGLQAKEECLPNDLSGGQQQRVAIGRALINNPLILFADEPTGNLDSVSAKKIMDLLLHYNKNGQTIIMVTHDLNLAKKASRVITFKDGKIIKDSVKVHN